VEQDLVKVTVSLEPRLLEWIEDIRVELGLRSRNAVLNRLLTELAGFDDSSTPD
jgi:metal-responsive CopG/Arc/MetJ family transcriptional regulator